MAASAAAILDRPLPASPEIPEAQDQPGLPHQHFHRMPRQEVAVMEAPEAPEAQAKGITEGMVAPVSAVAVVVQIFQQEPRDRGATPAGLPEVELRAVVGPEALLVVARVPRVLRDQATKAEAEAEVLLDLVLPAVAEAAEVLVVEVVALPEMLEIPEMLGAILAQTVCP